MQRHQFAAHLDAQLGIEIAQRLVEQERLGLLDDGAADGDALALAARELVGPALQQMRDLQDVGGLGDALGDLGLRGPLVLEAEAQDSARPLICG